MIDEFGFRYNEACRELHTELHHVVVPHFPSMQRLTPPGTKEGSSRHFRRRPTQHGSTSPYGDAFTFFILSTSSKQYHDEEKKE